VNLVVYITSCRDFLNCGMQIYDTDTGTYLDGDEIWDWDDREGIPTEWSDDWDEGVTGSRSALHVS